MVIVSPRGFVQHCARGICTCCVATSTALMHTMRCIACDMLTAYHAAHRFVPLFESTATKRSVAIVMQVK